MNGTVYKICSNQWNNKTFGFILGDDGQEYYFHKSNLVKINISSLQENDRVEFTPVPAQICWTGFHHSSVRNQGHPS